MRIATPSKMFLTFLLLIVFSVCLPLLATFHSAARAAGAKNEQSVLVASTTQKDWNMFSLNHSRFDTFEHILNTSNVSQLVPDWSILPTGNIECSSAVVANGIVYIVPDGAYNSIVYAVDARTGATHWSAALQHFGICLSPAVVNGVLYVSAGGEYAFNALTGQALWTNNTVKSDTSPVVATGLVYFVC